jgi:hypothetical protein
MRFFRFMAIAVLLMACVVLGSACAGAKGEEGIQGDQGTQGVQGDIGAQGPQGIQGDQGTQGPQGLPGVGIVWQGQWSNTKTYGQDEAVGYEGLSYISKQDSNANHLPTDTAWWDPWGATGPQGPQGETGATGATGVTGAQGPQGIQGEPGPNMIVAMGNILADGTISREYNVTSVTWDTANQRYQITLTGITYSSNNHVTLVTCGGLFGGYYESLSGNLLVYLYGFSGQGQGPFSFMVLECPSKIP